MSGSTDQGVLASVGRQRARYLRRWRARLSLVRARSVAARLLGSCADVLSVGDGVVHWGVEAGV